MDSVKEILQKIEVMWDSVASSAQITSPTVAPYFAGLNTAQINEAIGTLQIILNRVKTPKGFYPAFHTGKALATNSLSSALNALTQVQAGQYAHLPSFIAYIVQALSAMHSMLKFGDQTDTLNSLSFEFSEKLSVLRTAQVELSQKLEQLKKAEEIAESATNALKDINDNKTESESSLEEIKKAEEESQSKLGLLTEHVTKYAATEESLAKQLQKVNSLVKQLEQQQESLNQMSLRSKEQQDVIDGILPKAASAGLAHAFGGRVKSMEKTKLMWMSFFILSIAGLIFIGGWITKMTFVEQKALWEIVIQKLPFVAPLIWLGWFSAIQYGNSLRVQEDYAFKEATSKAFQGYHDHMQHLESISEARAQTALNLLSIKTIEILAAEPLRVYQKNDHDATPAQKVISMLTPSAKNSRKDVEE
ncbi:MAG: hypothetical protein LBH01_08205 [Verrucomicrobiales bacterium]|jgi:hypothetical protein|nr:hypothetical protein [Verrucomicrobiales bacterium]